RLRKRLKEYYENEGAGHAIRIEIPPGQYTPRFVAAQSSPVPGALVTDTPSISFPSAPGVAVAIAPAVPLEAQAEARSRQPRWIWLAAGLAIVAALAGTLLLRRRDISPQQVARTEIPAAPASTDDVRILCGVENGSYIDAFERAWQSDRFFQGGWASQAPRNHIVLGTRDQQLYQYRREGPFRYDIPLRPGVYELRLYFAESVFGDNNVAGGGETTRIFDVLLNGKPVLGDFDVIADAGPSTADVKVFRDVSPASDGKVHLEFRQNTNLPFVNAIAIVPGVRGMIRPVRIVARDRGLKDREGRYWDPDRYARGGQVVARPDSTVQAADPELYRSERFGNLTYTIPVAQPGRYVVNLYFAENWFGPGNPGGGGPGSRRFDILVNGIAVRRNFDILKESGAADRPAIVNLHGIEPNHQGKIVISLAPNQNYACINALEVLDESR
ncbi:MAG TPA: malectin domain-containing carbohydrate-binding protein, partial [Bryobacteraceae bacterium]|nr:malectin domain-containing carbohydrate-binding protein [Bryobacteraceae bacterium]